MKCFHIVIGISPVWGDTVKVMPRLPKGRRVSVKDFPLINTRATVDMETAYPVDNTQSMTLALHGEMPPKPSAFALAPSPPSPIPWNRTHPSPTPTRPPSPRMKKCLHVPNGLILLTERRFCATIKP